MHPLVIFAISQFESHERDHRNEQRRRELKLLAASTDTPVPGRRATRPAPARTQVRAATPAVIGCRA